MKKLLLFLLLCSFPFIGSFGQTYHPFPESNAIWGIYNVCTNMPICGDEDVVATYYGGDTVLGSFNYKKVFSKVIQRTNGACCWMPPSLGLVYFEGCMRQDTLLKRVYFRPFWGSSDSLLYDFAMNIGDTLKGFLTLNCSTIQTVKSIDSVLLGGIYRKRINFDTITGLCSLSIIEGIGSLIGLFNPLCNFPDAGSVLACFSENGICIFGDTGGTSCYGYLNLCDSITIYIKDIVSIKNEITIYPNPAYDILEIKTNLFSTQLKISVYDILGNRFIYKETSVENTKINISSLAKGIYFVKIENNKSTLLIKKFITQ